MVYKPMVLVPDGGWGWVVVLVTFVFHVLVGFLYTTLSVLYLALQEQFDEGKGVTSWILSLFNALIVFVGPVSASLGVKYGYKNVAFVGGLFMGGGVFLGFFANSIIYLILPIGLIAGTGAGLCYVPVIAMCALYFDKKRSLAVGLGTSGFGVGSFAMPPLITLLEEEYTWRGVLLILSGCLLNMCVLSLFLRPLMVVNSDTYENDMNGNGHVVTDGDDEKDCVDDQSLLSGVPDLTVVAVEELGISDSESFVGSVGYHKGNLGDPSLSHIIPNEMLASPVETRSTSNSLITKDTPSINIAAEIIKRKKYLLPIEAERKRSQSFNYRASTSLECVRTNADDRQYRSAHEISKRHNSHLDISKQPTSKNESTHNVQGKSLTNMSIMLMGSIYNVINLDSNLNSMLTLDGKTSIREVESQHGEDDSQIVSSKYSESSNECKNLLHRLCDVLCFYKDLMKHWKFSLMVAINVLVNFTYLIPVLFIVDRAVESGIAKDYAVISLSLYGVGNICGRILTGIIADLHYTNRMLMYFVCIFMCGFVTSLSVSFDDYLPLHHAYGFCFGVFIGGYVILTPLVLVDILGVELVGQSYGLCLLFQGFSYLIGTPMAGWIRDITGSYSITFALYGCFMLFSSLLILPLAYKSLKGDNCEKK